MEQLDAPQFMRALEDAPAATLQLRTGAIGSRVVAWCVLVIAGLVALLMLGLAVSYTHLTLPTILLV